jgi:hypothetical protein
LITPIHHTPYPINLASKKAAPAYPTSRDDIARHLIGAKMPFIMSLCCHDFLLLIQYLLRVDPIVNTVND